MKRQSVGLLIALLLFCGCGGDGRPSLVPVEGTVTLDGEPLADAQIVFQVVEVEGDYKRPSSGTTDASGKFSIGTYGKDDGLPIGKYNVGIMKRELIGDLPEDFNEEDPSASRRPVRYRWVTSPDIADPSMSGLTAEVTADGLQPSTFDVAESGEVIVEGSGGGNEP
ncbi:carboxypeptidase-like regulatory domain-containing protein [Maioricimonas sp. JC845]|uniref:carboxypeptidase-like regulatory domain-containing protein n=1 Tax=Maioricimonas sp. JC845 TaxID=3232138 RepID=UPI00345AEE09